MSSRPYIAPRAVPAEVLSDDFTGRVRDAISSRCSELERVCPEAVDIDADFVVVLHEALHGRATATRGNRPASVFLRMLRGENPINVEDLARLSIEAPNALVQALSVLAHRMGYRLEPEEPTPAGIADAAASAAESVAGVVGSITRDLADGIVDKDEAMARIQDLQKTKRKLAALETGLNHIARGRR